MKPKFRHLRSLAIASSALLWISYAQAAPFTWTDTTSGTRDWTTATNWSGSLQYVSSPSNELMFFADSTTTIGSQSRSITTNVPSTLSMNTLTLNGKGAASGASSATTTIGSSASTWTIGDGVTSTVNLNANFGATAAAGFNTTVAANLTLNQAVTSFTGNGTGGFTFSGNIGDGVNDYGITKSGSSALTLSGASTYSGSTVMNAGVLRIGSASVGSVGSITSSAIGTGGLTLGGGTFSSNSTTARTILNAVNFTGNVILGDATNTGKLTLSAATELGTATRTLTTNSEVEFAGAISSTGAFGITKAGAANLILSTSNSYTGTTTINAGALVLNHNNALSGGIGTIGGTSALTFNGGVLGLGAGDFTRNLGTAGTTTDVNFTGAGGWAAYAADRMVNLGGSSAQITWATANTGFNGQTLILSNATATHKVTLQNGLNLGTATRTVQVDNGTATVDAELSGAITGSAGGALTKTGAGLLALSNAGNNYVGVTTISGGVLRLDAAGALPGGISATGGTSNLTFNGGVLGLTDTNFTRSLNTAATASAATFTTSGGWAAYGADRVVNLGGASSTITWATAGTGFNGQTLILSNATATHMVDLQNPLALGNAARTVQVDNGTATIDAKLSGAISGTGGSITKTGAGSLWISGNMSHTGGITFSGGSLTFSGTNTYSGNTNFNSAGILLTFAGVQAVSPNSAYVMNINASTSDSSVKLLDDTGGVNGSTATATGSTFTIQNNNGPGNAHTFIVGNNNTSNGGTSSGTTTGSTIAINTLNWNTYAAGTTAYGPINIQGTDGYRLQINNVVLHNAANLTSGTVGQTTFNPTSANVTMGTVTVGTGNTGLGIQTFVMDGTSSDNRVTGAISNASDFGTSGRELRVTKSNSSTWTLSGNNTFTGLLTVTGATASGQSSVLTLSGDNIGMTGGVTINGNATAGVGGARVNINSATAIGTGTLTFGANPSTIANTSGSAITLTTNNAQAWNQDFTFATGSNDLNLGTGAVTLGGNRAITTAASTRLTVGGAISGTGFGVTKGGGGTLALTSSSSGYTGATTISQGTLEIGLIADFSSPSSIGAAASGEITIGGSTTNGTLLYKGGAATSNRTIRVGQNTAGSTGNATISNDGTGALTFTAAAFNTSSSATASRSLTLGGDSTGFTNTIQGTVGNNSSALNLVKSGSSTWALSGTNSYTGTTTVNGGTLLINGSTSTGIVTVTAAGTLGGTGTVGGATTVNGTFSPGQSPGTMTFQNTLVLAGSSIIEIDGTSGAGVVGGHDFTKLTGAGAAGALTYGGTMTVDLGVVFGAGSYSWNLFDFASETGGFTGITLADQYSGSLSHSGGGVWGLSSGGNTWSFTEADGVLALTVVPEPRSALLGAIGVLLLLRRRR